MKTLKSMLALMLLAIGVLCASNAQAQDIPRTLSVQGILTDAFGKSPLEGKHIIKTGIYESAIGGMPLYEQRDTLTLNQGLYQLSLGKAKGLPTTLKFNKAYFVDISVDGMAQTMRVPLQPAPYALMATNVAADAVGEEQLSPTLRTKLFPNNAKDGEATMANSVGGIKSVIAGGDNNATTQNYASIIGGYNNRVSGIYGTIGGGQDNQATGAYSFVGGGKMNRAQASYSSIVAGYNNVVTSTGTYASIGGGTGNSAGAVSSTIAGGQNHIANGMSATISGGQTNRAMNLNSTVGGGANNNASGGSSTIGGGIQNAASGQNSIIGGGSLNTVRGLNSSIVGGLGNTVSGTHSGIGFGKENTLSGNYTVITGGLENTNGGDYSIIGGGKQNALTGDYSVIGGGEFNSSVKNYTTISGGQSNTIVSNGDYATIAGGNLNNVTAQNATISGGVSNRATGENSTVTGGGINFVTGESSFVGGQNDTVLSDFSVVAAGWSNEINSQSDYSTISGGNRNLIITSTESTIGGGARDSIVSSDYSTISGGTFSIIVEGSEHGTIGGGYSHIIFNTDSATISGGSSNTITYESDASTIGGGLRNLIKNNIISSTINGGEDNIISNESEEDFIYYSTIGGGDTNMITETSDGSTIGGGVINWINSESDYSTISGGDSNLIDVNVYASTIGGGEANQIINESDSTGMGYGSSSAYPADNPEEMTAIEFSTIGGGNANTIIDGSTASTIGGGSTNNIQFRSRNSTIGGGAENTIVNENSLLLIDGLASGVTQIPGTSGFLGLIKTLADNLNPLIDTYNDDVIGELPLTGEEQEKLFIPTIPNPFDPEFTANEGATIGGGLGNTIAEIAEAATIAGGTGNTIEKFTPASTIGGGDGNTISFFVSNSTIGGGEGNVIENKYMTDRFIPVMPKVVSAYTDPDKLAEALRKLEIITLEHGTIAGGEKNEINDMSGGSSILGGSKNKIESEVEFGAIGGGEKNEMNKKSSHSVIAGGEENKVEIEAEHSSIGGGEKNELAYAEHSFIGSGEGNSLKGDLLSVPNPDYIAGVDDPDEAMMDIPGLSLKKAEHSFIGSGRKHEIEMAATSAIVSGDSNKIGASVAFKIEASTILGGQTNEIDGSTADVSHGSILGGEENKIDNGSTHSTIGGGKSNEIKGSVAGGVNFSAILSGQSNELDGSAAGSVSHSAIVGGETNKIDGGADGATHSTIAGGKDNTISGSKSFAFGEGNSVSSDLSMALGESMTIPVANPNEFRARFDGGIYFEGQGTNSDWGNHVAKFKNTGGTNGIAIEIATPIPNNQNNFVTFQSMGGTQVGRIEGQTAAEFTNDYDYQAELQSAQMAQAFATSWNTVAQSELTTATAVSPAYVCPVSGTAAIGPAMVALKTTNLAATVVDMTNMTQALTNFMTSRATNAGVTYLSGAGDYAEMLPKANPNEKFMSGQIVAVKGGKITKNTEGATQLMVISRKPIVLGNASEKTENDQHEKVAFLGQVPVVVRGEVALGDYILPDGLNMGIGVAVKPANMKAEDYKRIVGVAWSTSQEGKSLSEINVAVGLNGLAISQEVDKQNAIIAQQNNEMSAMKEELSALKSVLKGMNQALAQINPDYAKTVKTVLGTDAESLVKEKQVIKVNATESKISSSVSDEEVQNAVVLWRQQLINSGNSLENQPLLNKYDNDPAFRASVIERLKEVMNRKANAQSSMNSVNN